MIPRRVEAQLRWDQHLCPALWSLWFATKVNTGVSLSIKRCLSRGEEDEQNERSVGEAAKAICKVLWDGQYRTPSGELKELRGDMSKLVQAEGLTKTQKALLHNYHFMSARIPGTRQVRRSISHVIFSSRVVYGLPIFMTVTPGERHSGLMIRLTRYRRSDPAVNVGAPEFMPWVGYDKPLATAKGACHAFSRLATYVHVVCFTTKMSHAFLCVSLLPTHMQGFPTCAPPVAKCAVEVHKLLMCSPQSLRTSLVCKSPTTASSRAPLICQSMICAS